MFGRYQNAPEKVIFTGNLMKKRKGELQNWQEKRENTEKRAFLRNLELAWFLL